MDSRISKTPTHAVLTLFDVVSAAIGIASPLKKYGQQSLLRFEHFLSNNYDPARAEKLKSEFLFKVDESDLFQIDWSPLFNDPERFVRFRSENAGDLSAAFLLSVTDAALRMAEYGASVSTCRDILLSGKAFLSPSLTLSVKQRLEAAGFRVFRHELTSPDESSASIGQALFGGMA